MSNYIVASTTLSYGTFGSKSARLRSVMAAFQLRKSGIFHAENAFPCTGTPFSHYALY
ncbi:hypothetical protein [Clostridium sp. AF20-7]|uniref:hypothetical protein n=1 Tax=Clostridium sp. AF20-7 TaxID=2293002 RepID=UPI0015FC2E01|nr:hypothetical protein [Clostridium sp. AF20-7]